MGVLENGSLGLTKKAILKQIATLMDISADEIKSVIDAANLVKNRTAQVENWVDIAKAKFTDLTSRIVILENKAAAAQVKFVDIEKRLKALEL